MRRVRAHIGRVAMVVAVVPLMALALACGSSEDPVTRSNPSGPTSEAVSRPGAVELPDFSPAAIEGFAP